MRTPTRGAAARILLSVTALTAAAAVGLVAGVGAPADAGTAPGVATDAVRSVVVLGDSVAAGEGAADGYVYRDRPLLPGWVATRTASSPPRDRCGRTDLAYGALVARDLGARVTNLACSGASFGRGVVLDRRFDRAAPDLVLVTAGANSLTFERAYAYCVLAAQGLSDAEAARIASSRTVGEGAGHAVAVALRRVLGSAPVEPAACTAEHPGAFLEENVLARADGVAEAARELALDLRARGRRIGRVPDVVFTTYPDPLPTRTAGVLACPDAAGLGPAQLAYLHEILARLHRALRDALDGLPGVAVADAGPAFATHRWCDADPWTFGPSIFVGEPASRAPFHPTPAGHRAIADAILATRPI